MTMTKGRRPQRVWGCASAEYVSMEPPPTHVPLLRWTPEGKAGE